MEGLPAVAGVELDMNTGRAVVALKPGASITAQRLAESVREAGYTAKRVTLAPLPAAPDANPETPE